MNYLYRSYTKMTTSHNFFNALHDPLLADIFINVLSLRDLGNFIPVVAIATNNRILYDWLFLRLMVKRSIINSCGSQTCPTVRIPARFNKIYTRSTRRDDRSLHLIFELRALTHNYLRDDQKNSAYHYNELCGLLLYAHRTGWAILHAGIMPTISDRVISRFLWYGIHIAIDPTITIIDSPVEHLKYAINCEKCTFDSYMTDYYSIPNLTIYSFYDRLETLVMYLRSTDPVEIHNVIDAINSKIVLVGTWPDRIHVRYPLFLASAIPFVFYGDSDKLPAIITYIGDTTEHSWRQDMPVFRAYPIVTTAHD